MDKDPKENKFIYPPETSEESRAREILHELSILLGEVRSFNKTKLPISFFGEKAREIIDGQDGSGHVEITEYQRHDTAVWQLDTGDSPGNYGITLIERDRYHREDMVDPIYVSIELKTSLGILNISATIPSRHFSDIDWPRSQEEMSKPKISTECWLGTENVTLKNLADKFLEEVQPEDKEKFKYLLEIFNNCVDEKEIEFDSPKLIYIARFFEKFWRGQTQEESAR